MTYTDEQLIASAREHALAGMLNVVALRGEAHVDLKKQLGEQFSAILRTIDTSGAR